MLIIGMNEMEKREGIERLGFPQGHLDSIHDIAGLGNRLRK